MELLADWFSRVFVIAEHRGARAIFVFESWLGLGETEAYGLFRVSE